MRKTHSWWLKQQRYLQEKEHIQRKFDLYERIAIVLAQINSLLLDQQVLLFNRNKCEYMLTHCLKPEQVQKDYVNSEHQRYRQLVFDQNKLIREKKAEFQQIGFLGRLYFGPEFENYAMQVASSLKQAECQVIPLQELIQICNLALGQGKTLNDSFTILDPIFDQRWDERNPKNHIGTLLDIIYKELIIEKKEYSH